MKKNNFPIYLAIAVVFGILIGSSLHTEREGSGFHERKIKKLVRFIETEYLDSINTERLFDEVVTQIVGKLDPHSVYIPRENLQDVTESMQGNFVGIGVQFRMIRDSVTVIQPIAGGPSIEAGIRAGDRILLANADTLYNKKMSADQIIKTLKGEAYSKIDLQIYRKMNDSLFTIPIRRSKVPIKSVDVSYMLNDSIGYIKLDRFARTTYREFEVALNALLREGMTDLVLDLRGNRGGFVDVANKIADAFLEEGKLIVFTKNNKGEKEEFFATDEGLFEEGGLYILIDQNSISASEIVAGALQDNDKGVLVGRRSFGKGLVQEEKDLGDGSAVRLTVARYYTPTGRCIQKPYQKGNERDYYKNFHRRYTSGELFSKDSIKVIDSLQYKTPRGKIVYGGGGIVPDVFVPIDTTSYSGSFDLGSLDDFAFAFVDNHRKELSEIELEDFVTSYDTESVLNQYILRSLEKEKRPLTKKDKEEIKKHVKIFMARQLYGEEGIYKMIQADDPMLLKVLELESKEESCYLCEDDTDSR